MPEMMMGIRQKKYFAIGFWILDSSVVWLMRKYGEIAVGFISQSQRWRSIR